MESKKDKNSIHNPSDKVPQLFQIYRLRSPASDVDEAGGS